jgi:hypothetical protein
MATCTYEQKEIVNARYVGNTFQVALIDDSVRSTYNFSLNTGTDVITTATNTFTDQTRVTVTASGGGLLPSPLLKNTTYYWQRLSSTTGQLSLTRGGSVINITTTGTGTLIISDKALDQTLENVVDYTRQELTNYQGQSIRPVITPVGTPVIAVDPVTALTYVTLTASVVLTNASGTNPLSFNALLVIRGGSTAIGDTTGTPVDYTTLTALKVLPAGQADQLTFTFRLLVPTSTTTA